ncbi:MAG: S1 RNA-binding domain-containing protein, partial [Anaerolineae bacterium]|nr:S1 RNA-binding domain-containing protein [Anaerolineae bacterium]
MQADEVIDLTVIGYNRGGLLVEWRSLHGFVPASQLVESATNGVRKLSLMSMVGRKLTLRVIELNPEMNRLILSERAARVRPGERADILRRLQPGDQVEGTITNLCDFGAFVDLGGLEGLIHISELSDNRVNHPKEVVNEEDTVTLRVIKVDVR